MISSFYFFMENKPKSPVSILPFPKPEHAITALQILQKNGGKNNFYQLKNIEEEMCIALSTLESIFPLLEKAGLVTSKKGPGGGYKLEKPLSKISMAEILDALKKEEESADNGNRESDAKFEAALMDLRKKLSALFSGLFLSENTSSTNYFEKNEGELSESKASPLQLSQMFNSPICKALKMVVAMATTDDTDGLSLANRIGCSVQAIQELTSKLRTENFVISHRGKGGGYSLDKKPENISIGGIIRAILEEKTISNISEEILGYVDNIMLSEILPVGNRRHPINQDSLSSYIAKMFPPSA